MQNDARKTLNNIRSFVKVNRDAFQKILFFRYFVCFAQGLVFPIGGSYLKFVYFPLVKTILSLPQRLFGFHSTQKLRYRVTRAKPFKMTCRTFASLNFVQIFQIHFKTTSIMFTISKKNISFSFIKQ